MKTENFIREHKQKLLTLKPEAFEKTALELFYYQAEHNAVYKRYLEILGKKPEKVYSLEDIPFLPIEFFKENEIITGNPEIKEIFESSGTTGQTRSRHFVADTDFYKVVSKYIFEEFYGNLNDFVILALLPSYLERSNSSLVYMVDYFINESGSPDAGFYLNNTQELLEKIKILQKKKSKIVLIGVTFALLDLAEDYDLDLSNVIVMETGGMKGRRKEMIREEIHQILRERFHIENIHSEYGMTELLSQGYSKGNGIFETPNWMKILIREINDPFSLSQKGRNGGINVIDLANADSCAFIETQDIGSMVGENKFTILGRFDNSEIRGCNLMVM